MGLVYRNCYRINQLIYWNHPVGEISVTRDLHSAKNGELDVSAPNHGEALIAGEISSARQDGHSLFASVNQIRVLFSGIVEGA